MILTTLVLTVALWSSVSQPFEPKEFPKLFEACEYRYSGGQYHDHLFRYRLFVPRNLQPGERCPLLVWLHGKNESGEDNEWNLLQLPMIVNPSKSVEQYRFFVLAMQCPETDPTWSHGDDDADGDMLAVTYYYSAKLILPCLGRLAKLASCPVKEAQAWMRGRFADCNRCLPVF